METMCKYKSCFIVVFITLTIISFSSCDELFDRHGSGTYSSGEYELSETIPDTITISQATDTAKASVVEKQTKMIQTKQDEQDSILLDLKSHIETLEKKNSRMIESSTVYALMLCELLLLVCFYIIYRKVTRSNNKRGHISNDDFHTESGLNKAVRLFVKQQLEDLAEQINYKNKTQDDTINKIDMRLKKIEKSNDAYSGYYTEIKQENDQNTTVIPQVEPKDNTSTSTVFYMPRTMVPLKFDDSKKQFSRNENTYFKFVIKKENMTMFSFDPYDETCIKKAFDDRDNSLATVCDIEIISSHPRGYKNCEDGIAELRNGIWVVTKKLKLQYV